MPCDSVRNIGVILKDANLDILMSALTDMRLNPARNSEVINFAYGQSYNRATNELRVRDEQTATTIRRAYGATIVKSQARKFGWSLKEVGPYQYEVQKR